MRLLSHLSAVAQPARMQAAWAVGDDRWYVPAPWLSALSAAGITVTPDLALCLSAMYSGVTTIGQDVATLPAQTFRMRDDGGKDRVRPIYGRGIEKSNGIGSLAYMLRWQPNVHQTATEFWLAMIAQYLLREVAYAEIVSGPTGFMEQLLPRHPDRVTPERLPSGRLRYKLLEYTGTSRYLTQDEMFVVRGLSFDNGLTMISRVVYGAQAIGTALATQKAAGRFFKAGMTAAAVVTYKGGKMEEGDEAALHASLSRYAAGMDNAASFLVVPDDIAIETLGIDPEKAQMMVQQEWGVREIARLLHLPGHKLGIKDSVGYNSQVQSALEYVISCLRPIVVTFEQAIQRDLILAKDTYLVEFLLAALLRGDFESQANYLEKFIRNRIMRPSEARLILNMNPDEDLDALSARDFQPGQSARQPAEPERRERDRSARGLLKGMLVLVDAASRCHRRERAAVAKLAAKHADDVEGWRVALRSFFTDHAAYVAEAMHVPMALALEYCAEHGAALEAKGMAAHSDQWERDEAEDLAALAMECGERSAA